MDLLKNKVLEVIQPKLETRVADEAIEEPGLSAGIIRCEDVRLVRLVVRGVNAMEREDLISGQASGRVLARTAGQRLRTEAAGAKISKISYVTRPYDARAHPWICDDAICKLKGGIRERKQGSMYKCNLPHPASRTA